MLRVCMLRECECDGNAGVGDGRCVVAVSAGCECMGGTYGYGSGVVSSANDRLEMSGVRGVGGVCELCMCLDLGSWELWR